MPSKVPSHRSGRRPLRSPCPVAGALDLLGDRWTLLVVRDAVLYDKRRFRDFLASPEHIASNILADRLERLEGCGLITRRQHSGESPGPEYYPTSRALDLVPVLRELIAWGKKHVPGTANQPPANVSPRGLALIRGEKR